MQKEKGKKSDGDRGSCAFLVFSAGTHIRIVYVLGSSEKDGRNKEPESLQGGESKQNGFFGSGQTFVVVCITPGWIFYTT